MALYASGQGQYDAEYCQLWKKLVPKSGRAETLQGELVRIIGRLASEYYRNGNMNWENGYDAMLSFLSNTLQTSGNFDEDLAGTIELDVAEIRQNAESGACPYTEDEDEYDRLTDRVVEWCRYNSELIPFTEATAYDF